VSPERLIVFAVLFAIIFVVEVIRMRRRAAADPAWQRQMKETPWRDRRRIATAVRRGEQLSNPREARLAVGMAAEQRAFNGSLYGLPKLRLALGLGLLALGLLASALPAAFLGGVLVAIALGERQLNNRAAERIERAERLNREQAALEETG
jgi:hypothetical protein